MFARQHSAGPAVQRAHLAAHPTERSIGPPTCRPPAPSTGTTPGSHSRGPAPRRQPPRGGHPRKLQLSEAGQRLLRAGQRAGQPPRAGSDAGSTEGSPSQPRPPSPASAGGAARSRARESTSGSDPDDETDALAAGKQSTTASPRAVHRSTGLQAADEPAELQPAPGADATCSDEEDLPAEEGDDEAQKRLERLQVSTTFPCISVNHIVMCRVPGMHCKSCWRKQARSWPMQYLRACAHAQQSSVHPEAATINLQGFDQNANSCVQAEKELADGAAAQMAAQAQALVAERAEMAARNAALARENAQLLARLEFLEASVAATADDDNANGDGEQQQQLAEELGFLHDMLQRCVHGSAEHFSHNKLMSSAVSQIRLKRLWQ